LEPAGINTNGHPGSAKDYGPFLISKGFQMVNPHYWVPQAGDVIVFDAFKGNKNHPDGHIEVFDGKSYISDFIQSGFWAGSDYRASQPSFLIYRWGQYDGGYQPSYP
jgi:hypothetical protein